MTTEEKLIEKYKKEFELLTGSRLEVRILTKWELLCRMDGNFTFDGLLRMILDSAGWKKIDTFKTDGRNNKGLQSEERVMRRQIIDLIMTVNGFTMSRIGKGTGMRDHTTIMHSLKNAKSRVTDDYEFRTLLREIVQIMYHNIELYKVQKVNLQITEDTRLVQTSGETRGNAGPLSLIA